MTESAQAPTPRGKFHEFEGLERCHVDLAAEQALGIRRSSEERARAVESLAWSQAAQAAAKRLGVAPDRVVPVVERSGRALGVEVLDDEAIAALRAQLVAMNTQPSGASSEAPSAPASPVE